MKNNKSRLFIFIGLALVAVSIMYFYSSPPPPPDGPTGDSTPVKQYKLMCDSLGVQKWNSGSYQDLKSRLQALRSQQVIGNVDAVNLEDYLNLSYAQVLQDACKDWMKSNGDGIDMSLYNAMKDLSRNPKCSPFLTSEIDAMQCYLAALKIPSRVSTCLSSKLDLALYSQLMNDIQKYCNRSGISHFSKLSSISATEGDRLEKFKVFAEAYEAKLSYYNSNPTDFAAKGYMQSYCPDRNTEIKSYDYYLGDIQSTPGICI